MKTLVTYKLLLVLLLILLAIACDTGTKSETEVAEETNDAMLDRKTEKEDADFLVKTAASNYAEIHMAQLASNKSSDPAIKEIAAKLENDHNNTLNQVKEYADEEGIALPSSETQDAEKELADLASKEGEEFDKAWCKEMVDKHEESIRNFENRMSKTEDAELKSWIASTLPNLRNHHEMLKAHEESNNNGKSGR